MVLMCAVPPGKVSATRLKLETASARNLSATRLKLETASARRRDDGDEVNLSATRLKLETASARRVQVEGIRASVLRSRRRRQYRPASYSQTESNRAR